MGNLGSILPVYVEEAGVLQEMPYLELFRTVRGSSRRGASGPAEPLGDEGAAGEMVASGPSEADIRAEMIRTAVEAARAEEREAAASRNEAAIADLRHAHEAELERARASWATEQADVIGAAMVARFSEIEEGLSQRIATILKTLMTDAFRLQAIDETAAALKMLLSEAPSPVIQIACRADLADALKAKLGGEFASISFVPSDDVDIAIVASGSTIDTQLRAWSERLSQIVASAAP